MVLLSPDPYEGKIFSHHLYEYKKGLRHLVLYTTSRSNTAIIENKLKNEKVDYHIQEINKTKINVFFGNRVCIDVVKMISSNSLSSLTEEEDFILGTMLGYDRLKQCERYLRRKQYVRYSVPVVLPHRGKEVIPIG